MMNRGREAQLYGEASCLSHDVKLSRVKPYLKENRHKDRALSSWQYCDAIC